MGILDRCASSPTRHFRSWIALAAALFAVGCSGGGGGSTTPPPPTHTISGTVSGAVSAGVTVTLSGAANRATTTNGAGAYSFTGLADGSYTVQPSLAGYSFAPASLPVTLSGADATGRNFIASVIANPHAISGTVSGAVAAGVTVTLSGVANATTTTDGGGAYSFPGLADGAYTVTPSLAGYTFTPASLPVNVAGANVPAQDFTAVAVAHAISGTVSGAIGTGVTVTLSGAANATTTTNGAGAYSFSGLANGSYTVTPSLAGYTFTPAFRAVTLGGADATGRDFVSAAIPIPAPPANVAVRPVDGGALVTWDLSAGATSYNVYYGTTSALTTASPKVSATGTGAAIMSLPNGQRRFFAVSAVSGGGESALSSPRCGVPTASDLTFSGGLDLALYDALCDDRLDSSLWTYPAASSARVSGGAAELSVDAVNMEPRALRNQFLQSSANVNTGGARATTLSSLVTVPSATASRTGGAMIRAAVRLLYSPPALRLNYPSAFRDLLVLEIGLLDDGSGLRAYRNVYHCDDGPCLTVTTTGIAITDPPEFSVFPGRPHFAGAAASYDATYRFTASLDETTGIFHWSVSGGAFGAGVGGTADPAAYLAATTSWTGVSLAGNGFQGAAIAARAMDYSDTGGGTAAVKARFDDVQVGFNNGAAAAFDDFSGTGTNSGPTELSLAKWNGIGAPSQLPSGTGSYAIHAQATSTGSAATVSQIFQLSNPEGADLIQADVSVPTFTSTGPGAATAIVGIQGKFHNDGTGTTSGSSVGDILATVFLNVSTGSRNANYFIARCTLANCGGALPVLASGTLPTVVGTGVLPLRVGYDPASNTFTFGAGTSVTTLAAPAGASRVAPARAPMKRVYANVNVPAQAGTNGALDVTVNNVLVGTAYDGTGATCNLLDPSLTTSIEGQLVASAPPIATGGTIVDGTYRLTGMNVYTGAGGASGPAGFTMKHLWRFAGTSADIALLEPDGTLEKHSGTYGVSGSQLLVTESCPGTGSKLLLFTATATELRVQDPGNGVDPGIEFVLTRN